jgi:type II secretory pathway pseudopilin PulG
MTTEEVPTTTKGVVFIDESKNVIHLFEPIPHDLKPTLWYPKSHFAINRIQQEEVKMREATRTLVTAKVVSSLLQQQQQEQQQAESFANQVQQQVQEIMNKSKAEILEFLQEQSTTLSAPTTTFNWITDSTYCWNDLPRTIQDAAQTLGYTQTLWDQDSTTNTTAASSPSPSTSSPTNNQHQQQPVVLLPILEQSWYQLTSSQQQAAHTLGYNATTWDAALLEANHDTPILSDNNGTMDEHDNDHEDQERKRQIKTDNQDGNDETIDDSYYYDWGDTTNEDSSSSSSSGCSHEEGEAKEDGNRSETSTTLTAGVIVAKYNRTEEDDGIDEDEFIANFLSDDVIDAGLARSQSVNNNPISHRLADRYVPSDDEMEFGSDDDCGNDNDDVAADYRLRQKEPQTSTLPPDSAAPNGAPMIVTKRITDGELEEDEVERNDFSSAAGGGPKLFRRMLASTTTASTTTTRAPSRTNAKTGTNVVDIEEEETEMTPMLPPAAYPTSGSRRSSFSKKFLLPVIITSVVSLTALRWILTQPR